MHRRKIPGGVVSLVVFVLISWLPVQADDSLRYADLGDFQLENGSVIKDCKLAYRTLGELDSKQANAVLIPTWLAGTTKELIDLGIAGPGKVIDSAKYHVIAVDSFGNGVSSSPSNSLAQPDRNFPTFSIRDMVKAQHLLVTKHLKINRLHAVVGISMGAMQAFQWMVSFPDSMDRIVSIVGSPWHTSNDLLLWAAELAIIDNVQNCSKSSDVAMRTIAPLHTLLMWTPRLRVSTTDAASFHEFLLDQENNFAKYDAKDWSRQVEAIMNHDIRSDFEGSAEKTANVAKARALVITSAQDQIVYREPARTFSKLIDAENEELTGDCGHLAFLCERDKVKDLVERFLGEPK